ncbi:MAG: DUF3142 domain-containing protein [Reyranellaceae bacterium]
MRLLAALLLLGVAALSGSTPHLRTTTEPLAHDAYIWQRTWTPPVAAAARGSADIVRAWRVLLAEADRFGRWSDAAIAWKDLLATGRPVVAVIRIDGRLDEAQAGALIDQVMAKVTAASGAVAALQPGGALAGLEIDYDCPTSKLATYARFLAALRDRLPRSLALSITALPTWLNSRALESLAPPLDEIVLQVHAVDDPRRGLFDPVRAEGWVREFGRRIGRPFRVALPVYDVRVSWHADGRLASVEGEVPLRNRPRDSALLGAAPETVLRFLNALAVGAPQGLVGIAWFRLPTEADSRAWSLPTWRAVVGGALPPRQVRAALVPTERPDLWSVALANDGATDAPFPRQVRLDKACGLADGANGFRLKLAGGVGDRPLILESAGEGRLRAHRTRVIGWARCTQPGSELDVVE